MRNAERVNLSIEHYSNYLICCAIGLMLAGIAAYVLFPQSECGVAVTKVVKTVVYQTDYRFLKTGYCYRYRCDVIVRDRFTDLGLCYSDVTGQLAQNTSFKCRRMYRLISSRPNVILSWRSLNFR